MITNVLRANAGSCLGFGALFLALPGPVAAFLGSPPVWPVAALGAVLLLNGAHLLWSAKRGPGRVELLYFALGDAAWVAGTLALIASGTWITTGAGIAAALAVTAPVGVFAVLQWKAAGRQAMPAG
ncbi:hypothetical protein CKO28_18420 [Rhodovibrio sodomensis]|uniref:Uncharacterized protein n=1 Tax=Rhodovibrio sodomensis TaxID=1088 RepID=A0ABS1DJW7_9PROT|nr:hypothetical protein [Rhodovibrio sodomensis]MBK1670013.1 hypothetical protein [Rhodovibrio sodomensis]